MCIYKGTMAFLRHALCQFYKMPRGRATPLPGLPLFDPRLLPHDMLGVVTATESVHPECQMYKFVCYNGQVCGRTDFLRVAIRKDHVARLLSNGKLSYHDGSIVDVAPEDRASHGVSKCRPLFALNDDTGLLTELPGNFSLSSYCVASNPEKHIKKAGHHHDCFRFVDNNGMRVKLDAARKEFTQWRQVESKKYDGVVDGHIAEIVEIDWGELPKLIHANDGSVFDLWDFIKTINREKPDIHMTEYMKECTHDFELAMKGQPSGVRLGVVLALEHAISRLNVHNTDSTLRYRAREVCRYYGKDTFETHVGLLNYALRLQCL